MLDDRQTDIQHTNFDIQTTHHVIILLKCFMLIKLSAALVFGFRDCQRQKIQNEINSA